MLDVDLPALKQHWLSGRTLSDTRFSLFRRIFANTLPAVDRRERPRWLPQLLLSP